MADTPTSTKWLKRGLLASWVINFLIIGLVAGAALRGPFGKGDNGLRPPVAWMQGMIRQLPADAQAELRQSFADRGSDFRRTRRDLRQTRRQMMTILETEPYDADAMAALFERQTTTWRTMVGNGQDAFLETLANMSVEDRAAFASALRSAKSPKRNGQHKDRQN